MSRGLDPEFYRRAADHLYACAESAIRDSPPHRSRRVAPHEFTCCGALWRVGEEEGRRPTAIAEHLDAFRRVFWHTRWNPAKERDPESPLPVPKMEPSGWWGGTANFENQSARINALLFMAAIVESGDAK